MQKRNLKGRSGHSLSFKHARAGSSDRRLSARLDAIRKLNALGVGLKVLSFSKNKSVSDADLEALQGLVNLRKLALNGSYVTDVGLSYLAQYGLLQQLDLSGTRVIIGGSSHLIDSTRFQSLHLHDNVDLSLSCDSDDLRHLAALSHLEELNLSCREQVPNGGLRHLRTLVNLRQLNLSCCNQRNEDLLDLKALLHLQDLDLSCCRHVTDESLFILAPWTQCLNVSRTRVSDAGVAALLALTQLRCLDLRSCKLTDAGVVALAVLTNLEQLKLGACRSVTDAGVAALDKLINLRQLSLIFCHHVSDRSLVVIGGLINLQQLDVSHTNVTGEGLQYLTGLTRLERLNIRSYALISPAGIAALRAALPGLVVEQ